MKSQIFLAIIGAVALAVYIHKRSKRKKKKGKVIDMDDLAMYRKYDYRDEIKLDDFENRLS